MVRIALTGESRKDLVERLRQAYANRATRLIRRIHALPGLADGISVDAMAYHLGVGEQSVRDWLHAFVLKGVASLFYPTRRGRPPKLTSPQRQELRQLLVDGPEAAGHTSDCWIAAIIADLIHRRFKVNQAPRYVFHPLDRLGFR